MGEPCDGPDVTIVMPARDVAPFVGRAIDSCLEQTWPSWELLVIDDGSSDGTADVVRAFNDERVQLVASTGGLGPGGARNLALARAKGAYVAPLDADDAFAPTRLEVLLHEAQDHGPDTIVFDRSIRSEHDPFTAVGPTTSVGRPRTRPVPAERFVATSPPCKPLIPTELIRRSGATYPPELVAAEDYAFLVRLLDAGGTLREVDLDLYWHRIRPGSLTRSSAARIHGSQQLALSALADDLQRPELRDAIARRQVRVDELHRIAAALEHVRDRDLRSLCSQLAARPGLAIPLVGRLTSLLAYRASRWFERRGRWREQRPTP